MLLKFFNSLNCKTFNDILNYFEIKSYDVIIKNGKFKN